MAMDQDFPTDVLAEIMLRLPSSSRRLARLVCRRWRDVVNEHTTEMQSRPKVLLSDVDRAVAYVSDDDVSSPSSSGSCTELWRTSEPPRFFYSDPQLVGTCNGLLCLCDNVKAIGGAVTIVNPATDETLDIPPLPFAGSFVGCNDWIRWGDAYSFAYNPITGQYKLVHVPSSYDRVCEFGTIHVLTLGEPTWREVSAGPGGAICNLSVGIVSADGMTYWGRVTGGGAAKIVSFDLVDERVISTTTPIPVRRDCYRLTEVRGRLGFITGLNVWVLEEGERWSHRYNFGQGIPRRHFVYGEYLLTYKGLSYYTHKPKATPSSSRAPSCDKAVLVGHQDEGTLMAKMAPHENSLHENYEAFTYVENTDPLSVYATN